LANIIFAPNAFIAGELAERGYLPLQTTPQPSGGAAGVECGDGTCDVGENNQNCAVDCPSTGVAQAGLTPDVTFETTDFEAGTAISEVSNIYRKRGHKAWTAFTGNAEVANLVPGALYDVVFGINTTNASAQAYGEYLQYRASTVKEDDTQPIELFADTLATDLSFTFFNRYEQPSTYESVSAGDIDEIYVQWKAANDEIYGNPYIASSGLGNNGNHRTMFPNLLEIRWNTTVIDDIDEVVIEKYKNKLTGVDHTGVKMNEVNCPDTIVAAATGITSFCYESPVVFDQAMKLKIKYDNDDTTATGVDQAVRIHAGNFYIDSDDGNTLKWGNENEDGIALGSSTYDEGTLDFTP
jgi:hypothetical protein